MEDTDRVSSSCLRRGAGGVTAAAAGAGGGSSAVTMLKLGLRPRLRLRDFLRVNILVCSNDGGEIGSSFGWNVCSECYGM